MTAEPLGPALAAELGGVWDERVGEVFGPGWSVWESPTGRVWLFQGSALKFPLGRHSDGAAALACRARRLGVA